MSLDSTTWAALAFVLTAIGAVYTVTAWRRRGPAAGLRGLAWTLLPVAAWLTGTLRLATNVVDDVTRWAGRLVFDPFTWAGIAVFGVSVVLFVVSGSLLGRGIGVRRATVGKRDDGARKQVAARSSSDDGAVVDDDIAEILKRRGIN